MDYDSRPATLFHSQRVGELMVQVVKEKPSTAQPAATAARLKPPGLPIAHCRHLSDEGRADPSRAGRHGSHRWFDVTSADDRWCFGEDISRV
jgi:hypothetical protein